MLNLSNFNTILKKNHIGKILKNYKIKYSRVANEIDSKINEMMRLVLKDISQFLENVEQVNAQRQNLIEYEKNKKELELVKQKLKLQIYNEQKMKNDFEIIQQENNMLKMKIKSLNQKILNYKSDSSKNVRHNRGGSVPKPNTASMTPKRVNKIDPELNNSSVVEKKNSNTSLSSVLHTLRNNNNYRLNMRENNMNNINQIRKKINTNKFINQKLARNNVNSKRNISTTGNNTSKFRRSQEKNKPRPEPLIKNKNKNNSYHVSANQSDSEEGGYNRNNNYKNNPLTGLNRTVDLSNGNDINVNYEELGNEINEALDSELKELELDENNIKSLIEQLTNGNGNINLNLNN